MCLTVLGEKNVGAIENTGPKTDTGPYFNIWTVFTDEGVWR